MRKFVTLSLVIYFTLVIVVLVGGYMIKYHSDSKPPVTQSNSSTEQTQTTTPNNTPEGTSSSIKSYSVADVSPHNNAKNCWLIINSKVYDVSQFLVEHPGGINMIMPYCGKDATQAFNTRGGNGQHDQRALDTLNQYYIGNLK